MPQGPLKRQNIFLIIASLYLASILLVSIYPQRSWNALPLGLLLSSSGSVATFLLLRRWEISLQRKYRKTPKPSPAAEEQTSDLFHSKENFKELENALAESQAKQKEFVQDLNQKASALHKLEKEQEQFEQRIGDVQSEFNAYKTNSEEELRRKTVLLSEYQETINQQRDVIKKKQETISELESKVHDLNYEVKTLLQLAEIGNSSSSTSSEGILVNENAQSYQTGPEQEKKNLPSLSDNQIRTPEEAFVQLKRCVDIAQKITRSNHFGNGNSRFRDMPIDNYALNLRRLFDNLSSENTSAILVYSQKEKKLLFANDQTKSLLGWSPEKFIQNFPDIIQEGDQEWGKGINQLSSSSHSRVRLLLKTKSGQNVLVHCHLGPIPTGVFRNHVIGVMYPA